MFPEEVARSGQFRRWTSNFSER